VLCNGAETIVDPGAFANRYPGSLISRFDVGVGREKNGDGKTPILTCPENSITPNPTACNG
jgi:hypothetical protein